MVKNKWYQTFTELRELRDSRKRPMYLLQFRMREKASEEEGIPREGLEIKCSEKENVHLELYLKVWSMEI